MRACLLCPGMRVGTVSHMSNPTWPAYLRQAMDAAGFSTASALAQALGVNDSVVSRWLSGKTQTEVQMIRRLAPLLRRPVLELLVAAGHIEPAEAKMKDAPKPPAVPVGAGVDPDVLADLAKASPEVIEAVRALIRATKG